MMHKILTFVIAWLLPFDTLLDFLPFDTLLRFIFLLGIILYQVDFRTYGISHFIPTWRHELFLNIANIVLIFCYILG